VCVGKCACVRVVQVGRVCVYYTRACVSLVRGCVVSLYFCCQQLAPSDIQGLFMCVCVCDHASSNRFTFSFSLNCISWHKVVICVVCQGHPELPIDLCPLVGSCVCVYVCMCNGPVNDT